MSYTYYLLVAGAVWELPRGAGHLPPLRQAAGLLRDPRLRLSQEAVQRWADVQAWTEYYCLQTKIGGFIFHLVDLFERKGYMDDAEFDWTGRTMSTPVSDLLCAWFYHLNNLYTFYQVQNQDPISPSGRGRHNTGKEGGKVSSIFKCSLSFLGVTLDWSEIFLLVANLIYNHFAGYPGLERVEAQRYQHPGGSAGPEHAPQRAGSQVTPSWSCDRGSALHPPI